MLLSLPLSSISNINVFSLFTESMHLRIHTYKIDRDRGDNLSRSKVLKFDTIYSVVLNLNTCNNKCLTNRNRLTDTPVKEKQILYIETNYRFLMTL